jgi:hypothetical protein
MQSKHYQIDTDKLSGTITTAVFQIYYDPQTSSKSQEILISAYRLGSTCCNAVVYPETVLLDARKVTSDHACFVTFDITSAVQAWMANTSTNYGLEIEVSAGHCGRPSSVSFEDAAMFSGYVRTSTADQPNYRPVLFVSSAHSMTDSRRRRRQTLDEEYCESLEPGQPNCCLHDFRLHFANDLGWNWILLPRTVDLNQCSGECPPMWAEESNYTQVFIRKASPLGLIESISENCELYR